MLSFCLRLGHLNNLLLSVVPTKYKCTSSPFLPHAPLDRCDDIWWAVQIIKLVVSAPCCSAHARTHTHTHTEPVFIREVSDQLSHFYKEYEMVYFFCASQCLCVQTASGKTQHSTAQHLDRPAAATKWHCTLLWQHLNIRRHSLISPNAPEVFRNKLQNLISHFAVNNAPSLKRP